MIKRNIGKNIILAGIVLIIILTVCCCSFPVADTDVSALAKDELTGALKIAGVYAQFLDNENNDSVELLQAIENAKKTEEDTFGSIEDMAEAAAALLEAVNVFHDSYFMPDSEKTKDADLIKTLSVSNVKCAYDKQSKTFYYTMGQTPQRMFECDFAVKSGFDSPAADDGISGKSIAVFAEILDGDNVCPYSFIPEINTVFFYS